MFISSILLVLSGISLLTCTVSTPTGDAINGAHLRQTTRSEVEKRLKGSRTRAKRAAISGGTYPTCAESSTAGETVYATLGGTVAYFNDPDYSIYPSYALDNINDCAAKCGATSSCVAGAVHDGLCFLWSKVPASTKQDGGFQTFVAGSCNALPDAIASAQCCNTYIPVG